MPVSARSDKRGSALPFGTNSSAPGGDHSGGLPLARIYWCSRSSKPRPRRGQGVRPRCISPGVPRPFLSDSISESGGVILGHTGEGAAARPAHCVEPLTPRPVGAVHLHDELSVSTDALELSGAYVGGCRLNCRVGTRLLVEVPHNGGGCSYDCSECARLDHW
jgi:hypothetical protein